LKWLNKALEPLKLLAENREIDFESSNKLITLGKKINFPMKNPVFKDLQGLFEQAAKFKEKIMNYSIEKKKSYESLKIAKSDSGSSSSFVYCCVYYIVFSCFHAL